MTSKIKSHFLIIIFSIIYLLIGFLTYKDYGIGIEEHFQRSSGFYWLNYIFQLFDINTYNITINNKIIDIKTALPNLPPVEIAKNYGVLFDLPTAFIEVFFEINDSKNYFHLRHLLNYLIFYLSGIFFYKILLERISTKIIPFLGSTIYMLSPRIYGNSFFDGKDLFFLSILTITLFFFFKFEKKKNLANLFIFALFCAFATSSRIIGVIVPFTFIILIILKCINSKNIKWNLKIVFIFIFFYIFSLYLHWPYLWTLSFQELINFFETFKVQAYPKVFFKGNFFYSHHLPLSYIPMWIAISTPIFCLLLFFIGFTNYFRRFFLRLINIKEKSSSNDLWSSNYEKNDLIVFIIFSQILLIYFSTSLNLFSGWRHFIFINFFISYFSAIGLYFIFCRFRKNYLFLRLGLIIFLLFNIELIFKLVIYHPYQSVYFNNLISDKDKKLFEVDTQSLSRVDGIKDIINTHNSKTNVSIGTASWTPLENARALFSKSDLDNVIFKGTSNKETADYIYSNHYFEIDVRYNKKYEIPSNFYLYKTFSVDNTRIYSIYKKKIN
ncbi:glycosyltransferase family 39 protein [Pelagibacteraceae bacterium]|nr:glycosyltransferase family 39 protein [Pelagibacteraceae bacterium]